MSACSAAAATPLPMPSPEVQTSSRALSDQPFGRFGRLLHVIERAGEDLDDCRRRIGLLQAGL